MKKRKKYLRSFPAASTSNCLNSAKNWKISVLTIKPKQKKKNPSFYLMPSSREEKNKKPDYSVLILPSAQKQLAKLPSAMATRIEDKLLELEKIPGPGL